MKITATRNGITARFSETVWHSGVPQKNGWVPTDGEGKKVLPKQLVDLSEARKAAIKDPVGRPQPGAPEKKSAAENTEPGGPVKPPVKPPIKPAVKGPGKPQIKKK